jgi:hypothetical protein
VACGCQDASSHDKVVLLGFVKTDHEVFGVSMIVPQQCAKARDSTCSPMLKGNRVKISINNVPPGFNQIIDLFLKTHCLTPRRVNLAINLWRDGCLGRTFPLPVFLRPIGRVGQKKKLPAAIFLEITGSSWNCVQQSIRVLDLDA